MEKTNKRKKHIKSKETEKVLKEELTNEDYRKIQDLIRMEVASILFDMYRKRRAWINA